MAPIDTAEKDSADERYHQHLSDEHNFGSSDDFNTDDEKKDHALAAVESKSTLDTDDGFKFNQGDVMAILMDDDDELPALTLRMWVMAICLGAFVAGVDAFST